MDVEVLDLDAHKYLVLQLWDVGVADVEVSDVALLLKSFVILERFYLYRSYLVLWSLDPPHMRQRLHSASRSRTHLSQLVAHHLELEGVDPAAVDVEAAWLLLAGAVGHVLGALVGGGGRVLLGPGVEVNPVPRRERTWDWGGEGD